MSTPSKATRPFLQIAQVAYNLFGREKGLDSVFDLDEFLEKGDYDDIDRILQQPIHPKTHSEILLSVLTVTAPYKEHLPSRADFRQRVRDILLDRFTVADVNLSLKGL